MVMHFEKKWANRRGLGLVDVLIGIMIISVALVGFALTFRHSTISTITDRNYNQATYYAQQAIEQLKVNDGQEATAVTWAYTWQVTATGTLPAFTIMTAQITNAADLPAEYTALSADIKAKLIPVLATVTWQESGGAGPITRTVKVISYYYLK